MKSTFLLAVLVFLFAFSSVVACAAREQVRDTTGKLVRAAVNYYIIPASPNIGGVSPNATDQPCPPDVFSVDGNLGMAVAFWPVSVKKDIVRVNTDLNIDFQDYLGCSRSSLWRLKDYDYLTQQWFVSTGGFLGNPGRDSIGNWFKIEKYEDDYKLSYCPNVCPNCSHPCMDIGIYEDKYGKRLALSSVPYKVRFQII
ncbi:hypothetical protein PIB30_004316 [Stylosanthes scabra]|uniref:Miraculin-like n=1 Tax=Stylosanthes scabra TaxID=79078 RepID=A0ABU6T5K4_9FABA|nr:hypothetical protein [Stylosanthes scabra]